MKINLFDDLAWLSLRPLTFTRPVADLRIGILTISEKWSKWLNAECGFLTQDYLSIKYPKKYQNHYCINGSVCPDQQLVEAILNLKPQQALLQDNTCIAYKPEDITQQVFNERDYQPVQYTSKISKITFPNDIFTNNHLELNTDFELLTKGKKSNILSSTNTVLGDDIFVEENVVAECATFNTLQGPIYLGKNSQVMEGCHIRGSFALGENSNVKMGSKIYGQTTIGPYCNIGGEVNNAVMWGYSSKGHDGYLGNSVVGQWCNMGADSNNSNLKNNYAEVRLWDYNTNHFRNTGLQFCGLIMADHAKCAINTMFNTGTVVGVSASVFGAGFPNNFIPDFAWGGSGGFEVYSLNKMFETTERVYARRNMPFDQIEKDILTHIFKITEKQT